MSGAPSNPIKSRKRILVADDDPSISRLLERVLAREYDVYASSDGNGAISLAEKVRPHLMVLDVMMPGQDGFAVAQRVRAVAELKNTPIIFLTARDGPLDTIKGIQAGARHYITKPFKIEDLLSKVKKILG